MAQSALVHTNDTSPGITRRALKRGWAYYDGDGQPGVVPADSSGNFGGDVCDNDDDEDRVKDVDDNCPMGELGWTSNSDPTLALLISLFD